MGGAHPTRANRYIPLLQRGRTMAFIASTKEEVRAWFDAHPAARELVESTEIQWRLWRPEYAHEDYHRMLTVDDICHIAQGGWQGEPGVFAWFYPCGVPNYMCVEEPPAIEWPEDHGCCAVEEFWQMAARHNREINEVPFVSQEFIDVAHRHEREVLEAMWDDDFAFDAFLHEMQNVEYSYSRDDADVLDRFGHVTSSDYRRGIAELGLPERICKAYERAARTAVALGD